MQGEAFGNTNMVKLRKLELETVWVVIG